VRDRCERGRGELQREGKEGSRVEESDQNQTKTRETTQTNPHRPFSWVVCGGEGKRVSGERGRDTPPPGGWGGPGQTPPANKHKKGVEKDALDPAFLAQTLSLIQEIPMISLELKNQALQVRRIRKRRKRGERAGQAP